MSWVLKSLEFVPVFYMIARNLAEIGRTINLSDFKYNFDENSNTIELSTKDINVTIQCMNPRVFALIRAVIDLAFETARQLSSYSKATT